MQGKMGGHDPVCQCPAPKGSCRRTSGETGCFKVDDHADLGSVFNELKLGHLCFYFPLICFFFESQGNHL